MKHTAVNLASFLLVLAAMLLFLPAQNASFASPAEKEPDVRNVRWGMSKQQVMDAEKDKKPSFVGKSKLSYDDTLLWEDSTVDYAFDDKDKLFDVLITIQTKKPERTTLAYIKMSELMHKKYGAPSFIQNDGMEMEFGSKRTAVLLVNDKDSIIVRYTKFSASYRRMEENTLPDMFYLTKT